MLGIELTPEHPVARIAKAMLRRAAERLLEAPDIAATDLPFEGGEFVGWVPEDDLVAELFE